ncbi:MAG: S9 family peptidase [Planctomycetes bacterium]|nr:S9 family peptidase [Planctomycetota bacterium]NOG53883.1 S9 family peptidase [Planctomycetota bacterium]
MLFGNPDKAGPQISPDGTQMAFLAPLDGVLNVWVAPVDSVHDARPITHDTGRGVTQYSWAYTNEHLIYLQDQGGDENWRIYCVELATSGVLDLTPYDGVQARIEAVSPKHPDAIIVGLNNRQPQFHDLHRVNIRTGASEMIEQNNGLLGYMLDDDYKVQLAFGMGNDGSMEYLRPTDIPGGWSPYMKVPSQDTITTNPIAFDKTAQNIYLLDSRDRDTAALKTKSLIDGSEQLLYECDFADIRTVLLHPTERRLQGVGWVYTRSDWAIIDPAVRNDFDYLERVCEGDPRIVSRSEDDMHWIVAFVNDNGPVQYYHLDRSVQLADFLFTNRSDLEDKQLSRMYPEVIKSRDGLNLVSYLTLPPDSDRDHDRRPDQPKSLVLLVHGGPWARDSWGYDPMHQWLANRGYAVLAVNFRGSTGFGKSFVNAANQQWARTMHDDLLDAVQWAVDEGITTPDQVAIMGGSYGGYATLVGLTMTPDVFACGVDIVGPSNLITLLNSIPPYWKPLMEMWAERVGDPRTEEGRALLIERSPLTYVDRITKPLLIGQGANDPRVNKAESDQLAEAMESKGIPVTYVLYPDEGHGFRRPENNLSFFAITEAFLHEHLQGGRVEPIGNDFTNSSLQILFGVDQVMGLAAAYGSDQVTDEAAQAEPPKMQEEPPVKKDKPAPKQDDSGPAIKEITK